jgi:hypothetical protein
MKLLTMLHSESGICGKDRHYSGYTLSMMLASQSQSLKVTLDLDTDNDKIQSFNHGEEQQRSTASDRSNGMLLMVHATGIYI